MSIKLTKNRPIQLTKENGQELETVMAGMGWRPSRSNNSWDLDQTLICTDKVGDVVETVSYMNPQRNNSFYYHGDDLTGGSGYGNNDDEQIDIHLKRVSSKIERIVVVMNIYQAYSKRQQLYDVNDCYIRLEDVTSGKELAIYQIEKTDAFRGKTGMIVGEFRRKGSGWEFNPIGEPVRVEGLTDLEEYVKRHYKTGQSDWKDDTPAPAENKKGFLRRFFD